MHRTQIMLEDSQYQRLREQSAASGTGIGELIRRAVDQAYGTVSRDDRLRALDASFGGAETDDFDGLDGAGYVKRNRRGLGRRLSETVGQ